MFIVALLQWIALVQEMVYYRTMNRLNVALTKLTRCIIKYPREFVLIPLLSVFILSSPAIYRLYNTPGLIEFEPLGGSCSTIKIDSNNYQFKNNNNQLIDDSNLEVSSLKNSFFIKQIWFLKSVTEPSNVLTRSFLTDSIDIQNKIIYEINAAYAQAPNPPVLLSFLSLWKNSKENLENDPSYLRTIQTTLHSNSYHIVNPLGLLGGVEKTNGIITSAKVLKLVMVYNGFNQGEQWDLTIYELANLNTTSKSFEVRTNEKKSFIKYIVFLSSTNFSENVFLFVSGLLGCCYVSVSLINYYGIKYKLVLIAAFIVELILSTLSAISLTYYFLNDTDFVRIPVQSFAMLLVVIASENTFRVIAPVSNMKEKVFKNKFARLVNKSNVISTTIIFADVIVLVLITPFASTSVRRFALLTSCGVIVNHFLHLTYFTAMLSMDARRFEFDDLLSIQELSKVQTHWLFLQNGTSTIGHIFLQLMLLIKLPVFRSILGSVAATSILTIIIIKWLISGFSLNAFDIFRYYGSKFYYESILSPIEYYPSEFENINEDFLGNLVSNIIKQDKNYKYLESEQNIDVFVESPLIAFLDVNNTLVPSVLSKDISSSFTDSIESFDIYYFLELTTCVVFLMTITCFLVKYFFEGFIKPMSFTVTNEEPSSFSCKDLYNGGHSLDIIKIACNRTCPFIVTVGMDHRVLVWSPMADPIPPPMVLPITNKQWPISNITMLLHGNLIAIISAKGLIKIWSRVSKSWGCQVELEELKGETPLVVYFRRKTSRRNSTAVRRRGVSQVPPPLTRKNSSSSILSAHSFQCKPTDLITNFENEHELVLVLKTSKLIWINCGDSKVSEMLICKQKLHIVTAKLLISPRMPDKIVCGSSDGRISVCHVVLNNWRSRTLYIQERYNLEDEFSFMSKLTTHNQQDHLVITENTPKRLSRQLSLSSVGSQDMMVVPSGVSLEEFESSEIVAVLFAGFIVRTYGLTAELVDVMTGTVMKRFSIAQFKKDSFKVWHDLPNHCRFCGCASINVFCLIYTEKETGTLMVHTFSNVNCAKTTICLRVERDPRETRCLGFDSVVEEQHWLEDVECWQLSDLDMVMGLVPKKSSSSSFTMENANSGPVTSFLKSNIVSSSGDNNQDNSLNISSKKPEKKSETSRLLNRFKKSVDSFQPDNYSTSFNNLKSNQILAEKSFNTFFTNGNNSDHQHRYSQNYKNKYNFNYNNNSDSDFLQGEETPSDWISDSWQGFTMDARGKVQYFDIPPIGVSELANNSSTATMSLFELIFSGGGFKNGPNSNIINSNIANSSITITATKSTTTTTNNNNNNNSNSISGNNNNINNNNGAIIGGLVPFEGLLVKHPGSVAKFGHKSIVVLFGNMVKVLYLHGPELVLRNLDEDGYINGKTTGLSFVNKRRMRRTELNASANFEEAPGMDRLQ